MRRPAVPRPEGQGSGARAPVGSLVIAVSFMWAWRARTSPSHVISRDEQVVKAALAVRGEERVLDAGGDGRAGAQLPVRDRVRGEIDDVDRNEAVGRQGLEVLAAPMDGA